MSLRFEQPWWLLTALLAVPMVWVALRWFVAMSPMRRVSAAVFRAGLIVLIAMMLAGATFIRTSKQVAVVAVVDVSGSVRTMMPSVRDEQGREVPPMARVRALLERVTKGRGPEDLLGVVVFDGQAISVAACTSGAALDRNLDLQVASGTDIAAGIRAAGVLFPPGATRRILLISDGVETEGKAVDAARELAGGARATPIDVVPIRYEVEREVFVESIDVPPKAPAGATVTARVTLGASAPATGVVRLQLDGEELRVGDGGSLGKRVSLVAGNNVVLLSVPLGQGRLHKLQATFEPDAPDMDTMPVNNRAEAFTLTPGNGSVLLVDGVGDATDASAGAVLARTLRREGVEVRVVSPGAFPQDLLSLQAHDLVMLQNVPADALGEANQKNLARFVSEIGGGLVMIGGPDSFGAGGWKGTPIEPILPVKLDLPEQLVIPSTAVIFVMDTSGSMQRGVLGSSRSQQDIANLGAAMAIRSLDKTDLVGVIEFNSNFSVVQPLGKNVDPEATAQKVLSLAPGGGTNLPPALREAFTQIANVKAELKHVIVMSDGMSQGRERLGTIAQEMNAKGIRISSIAVGDEVDEQGMALLADLGRGEYFRVRDAGTLPKVFVRAVRVVRTPMIREKPFVPIAPGTSSPLLEGVDLASMPALGGLTLTQPRAGKDNAETQSVTYALVTDQGEPVLAHWQAGLGQVAAFTSDAHKWAKDWLAWPGYARLWRQVVRSIARPPSSRNADLSVELAGDQVKLRLEIASEKSEPLDGLRVAGSVFTPDGTRLPVTLSQTGPGVYQGVVPVGNRAAGSYVATLTPRAGLGTGERALAPVVGGAVRAGGEEFRALRSNATLVEQVASVTGGRVFEFDDPKLAVSALYDRSKLTPIETRLPLWPVLIVWALVAMVLDVGTRRLAWDRLVSKRFGASVVRETAQVLAERGSAASATLGSLRKSSEQARPSESAVSALSDADAKQVADEARKRRKAERAAGAQASGVAGSASASPSEKPSDLLAAKRRAQQQIDKQREG